jgi:hypothetical protein
MYIARKQVNIHSDTYSPDNPNFGVIELKFAESFVSMQAYKVDPQLSH